MSLTSARIMLKSLVVSALTTAAATKVYVRNYAPTAEELKSVIAKQETFIAIVPMTTTDISRISETIISSLLAPTQPFVVSLANKTITVSGDTPLPGTVLVLGLHDQVIYVSFTGTETVQQAVTLIANTITTNGFEATVNDDAISVPTVRLARLTVSQVNKVVVEVGRDSTLFKVTINSWSETQRDLVRDMIVPRVGSRTNCRVLLDDGTYALVLRETEKPNLSQQDTLNNFITDIVFVMEYAVTLSDLATPVAAVDTAIAINGSQATPYIF